jgi:Thioredoxin
MKLLQKTFSALLLALAFSAVDAIAANPVVELTAAELTNFVKQHETVIVQMISSDPKCGGCPGADKKFDQIAAKRFSKPVVFARVQWANWQDFPKFDPSIKVFSAPVQLFFKNGEQIDSVDVNFTDAKDIVDTTEAIEDFASLSLTKGGNTRVLASPHVIELQPAQFQAFIAQNPWAVVQFLSSDLNCSYCISAAYTFNSAAKHKVDKKVPFARVQWTKPWRNIPNLSDSFKLVGIPSQIVFHKGTKVSALEGKPQDRDAVFRAMNDGFEKVRTGTVTHTLPAAPAASVSTTSEEATLRLQLRHEFFKKIDNFCSKQFPSQANDNSKLLAAWKVSNQTKLDEAAAILMKRATQGADVNFNALVTLEKASTRAWQVNKLGIPDNRAPQADECTKMMGSLALVD